MKAARSERIQLVVDLVKRSEEQAAVNMQSARTTLENDEQRLAELEEYYRGYQQRSGEPNQVVQSWQLANSREFLHHLSDAIRQQEIQVQRDREQYERCLEQWQKIHLKYKSLKDFKRELAQGEALEIDKRAQRLQDDQTLIRLARR